MTFWLDAEQVMHMHASLLDLYGGEEGGGHRGAAYQGVDAAVQAVKNSYRESLVELAASYAVYIVQGHVFMDGNKRAGSAAMLVFLEANGHETRLSGKRLVDAMLLLQKRAETGASTDALIDWLAGLL